MQSINALNGDRAGAVPFNLSAHLDKALGQIDNFRLTRRVLQHCGALGQCCCQQRIFRCPHRDNREIHGSTGKTPARCFGMDVAVA